VDNINDWIKYGIEKGWAEQMCYTHDYPAMTDEESEKYYMDEDQCIPMLRVWL